MSNSYLLKSHPNRTLYDHLSSVALSTRNIIEDSLSKMTTTIPVSDILRTAFTTGATHDIGKGTTFFQTYLLNDSKILSLQSSLSQDVAAASHVEMDLLLKSHSLISSLYSSWVVLRDNKISKKYKGFLALASSLAVQGHHGSLKRPTSYVKGLDNFEEKNIFLKQIESFHNNIEELENISSKLGLESFKDFTACWEEHFYELSKIAIKSSSASVSSSSSIYSIGTKKIFQDLREPYFLINVLYSALLDADRMDAANIKPERVIVDVDAVLNFVKMLRQSRDNNGDSNIDINKYRNLLFETVQQKAATIDLDESRIVTLTAPTGVGKTLTSMNFALNLRKLIEKEKQCIPRIIYVAPFISILDQNMEVFQKVFQIKNQKQQQQTNLLLMHHHLASINYYSAGKVEQEQKREAYSTSQSELLIQGWNAEIIVTTFVQFFNTIFGRYTSQLRRLHNIIGSIIILDEIQSIPFEYWDAVRNALLFLSKNFHSTIIMMTATQPLIFKKEELTELSSGEIQTLPQRVAFHPNNKKGINIRDFCVKIDEIIKGHPKQSVLVEVNTISNAVEVFNSLFNSLDNDRTLFFLSAQIIPKHRKPRIDEIKEKLRSSEPLVLVSTQVVEAGVDLDFNIAIRDIGPIDSIIQTAGRCNRNGSRKDSDSPFYIYRIVNDEDSEFAKQVYGKVSIDIANELVSKSSNVIDLLQSYYLEIIRRRSSTKSDKVNIAITELNYEGVEETFELIDQDYKLPVFVEVDEEASKTWHNFVSLTSSSSKSKKIEIKHQMEQYMIGVSEKDVEILMLRETSDIYKIDRKDIGNLYNETIGLMHIHQK